MEYCSFEQYKKVKGDFSLFWSDIQHDNVWEWKNSMIYFHITMQSRSQFV